MKRPAFVRCAATCVLLLLAASPGRADLIVANEFWRTPTDVLADNGLGRVSFNSSPFSQALSGSTGLIAATLQPIYTPANFSSSFPTPFPGPVPFNGPGSSPTSSDPAVFDHTPFRLVLFVQDSDTGATGSLAFKGVLNGSFSPQFSHLTATISPPDNTTLHLGHHLYHVTVDPTARLGLPGDGPASIGADLTVTHNPEPSSLILAAIGVPGLGLTFWRRFRGRR